MKAFLRVVLSLVLGLIGCILACVIFTPIRYLMGQSILVSLVVFLVLSAGIWRVLSNLASSKQDRHGKSRTANRKLKISIFTSDHYKDETFEVKVDHTAKTVTFSARTYIDGWITRTAPLGSLQYARQRDSWTTIEKAVMPGYQLANVAAHELANHGLVGGGSSYIHSVTGQAATYNASTKTVTVESKLYDRAVTHHHNLSQWYFAIVEKDQFTQATRVHVEAADENPKFFDWLKQHEAEFRSNKWPEEAFISTTPDAVKRLRLIRKAKEMQRASDAEFEANRKRETKALLEQHRAWNKSGKSSWHHFE
ncbi:MAG: hypothetical protein RSP_05050 [Rhodanobacter sp.]